MKCPHCLVEFHDAWTNGPLGDDVWHKWEVQKTICAACRRVIVRIVGSPNSRGEKKGFAPVTFIAFPRGVARAPLSTAVPELLATDYKEACLVLADSPKASAALSRRCLQHLLRTEAGVKHGNLADEIQEVLDSKRLPSYLAEAIDGVRNFGNFAAHPIKSRNTGEIVEVEPGEAEWLLDTLEGLFDFYFVQPAALKAKRDALNKKLADVGKPPMKQP